MHADYIHAFAAATLGALVSVVFCRVPVPGIEGYNKRTRLLLTLIYVLLAGYVAVAVLGVTQNYQAFVVGAGLDSLLRHFRQRVHKEQNENHGIGTSLQGNKHEFTNT